MCCGKVGRVRSLANCKQISQNVFLLHLSVLLGVAGSTLHTLHTIGLPPSLQAHLKRDVLMSAAVRGRHGLELCLDLDFQTEGKVKPKLAVNFTSIDPQTRRYNNKRL